MLSDIIALRTIPAIVFSCVSYFMIGLKPTVAAFFTFMSPSPWWPTQPRMALAISADQTIFAGLLVNFPPSPLARMAQIFSIPTIRPSLLCRLTSSQNHVALGVMTFCFLTIAYLKLRFIRKFT
ncbi:hypothetical protein KUCAC02_032991 [Chaenocephalus aceratus]|nr:hypothetical protein KUCAC02_032991 [Chaenocephalus aceratus]